MFKVPDWESDIPKSRVDFSKKAKTKKSGKGNVETSQHFNLNLKKTQKESKVPNNSNAIAKKKTKKHKKGKKFITDKEKEFASSTLESPTVNSNTVNIKKKNKNKALKDSEIITELNFQTDKKTKLQKENTNKIKPTKSPKKRKHQSNESKITPHNNEVEIEKPILAQNTKISKKSKLKMINTNSTNEKKSKKPKKRKHNESNGEKSSNSQVEDEIPVKPKKIKFNDSDESQIKFNDINKSQTTENDNSFKDIKKTNSKKEKLKKILELQHRSTINVNGNKLRERMLERLKAAQFRYLNEKLYTSSGNEAKDIFQADPEAFHTYHQGYQLQVKKWPVNPLDVIVKKIQKMPKTFTIADMGCGEAALSKRVPHKVHSFDLVSAGPGVTACDMAHTPLLAGSVDVAVYCLALMGTQLTQYLVEANRVLKPGGQLLIAEVESRFDDVTAFTKDVEKLGFKLKELDKEHSVFFFLHFIKTRDPPAKKNKLPQLQLKPCLYKKR